MKIFCLPRFKDEFIKLKSKKAYSDLENDIKDYFFGKETGDLCNGTRLNHSDSEPYIKKRLKGRGGYRVYYLLIIKNGCLYLMFLHPKAGPEGADNIDDKAKALIYKEVLEAIKTNELFELGLCNKGTIQFTKLNPIAVVA